jgi:hypothetical protein
LEKLPVIVYDESPEVVFANALKFPDPLEIVLAVLLVTTKPPSMTSESLGVPPAPGTEHVSPPKPIVSAEPDFPVTRMMPVVGSQNVPSLPLGTGVVTSMLMQAEKVPPASTRPVLPKAVEGPESVTKLHVSPLGHVIFAQLVAAAAVALPIAVNGLRPLLDVEGVGVADGVADGVGDGVADAVGDGVGLAVCAKAKPEGNKTANRPANKKDANDVPMLLTRCLMTNTSLR